MADSGDTDPQAATQTVVEVSTFANYLRRVVPVLLEDADDTPECLIHALKDKSSIECIKKFLSDPQVPVLAIHRLSSKDEGSEAADDDSEKEAVHTLFHLKSTSIHQRRTAWL